MMNFVQIAVAVEWYDDRFIPYSPSNMPSELSHDVLARSVPIVSPASTVKRLFHLGSRGSNLL